MKIAVRPFTLRSSIKARETAKPPPAALPRVVQTSIAGMFLAASLVLPSHAAPDAADRVVNIEDKDLPAIVTSLNNVDGRTADGILKLVDAVEAELADVEENINTPDTLSKLENIETQVDMIKSMIPI